MCVLVYKITAYAKTEHWERNYLISNWTADKVAKNRGICFLPDRQTLRIQEVLVPMIRLILERDGKQIHVKRIVSMLSVWNMLRCRNVPTHHYGLIGYYETNFNSTASSGSDQRVTLGNIRDDGDIPFLGTIAAMEIYVGITEEVSDPIKEEIMKTLCRDYKVDIDSF